MLERIAKKMAVLFTAFFLYVGRTELPLQEQNIFFFSDKQSREKKNVMLDLYT